MTADQDLSAPQIEWPDEIWAEGDSEGGFGIYRTSFFATVDQPCEHSKYVHHGVHDSLVKYHATMIENGQLITLADHERAAQAAVAKAVEAERMACAMVMDMVACDLEEDALRFRGGTNPHHARMAKAETARKYAAAIRSRGVAG